MDGVDFFLDTWLPSPGFLWLYGEDEVTLFPSMAGLPLLGKRVGLTRLGVFLPWLWERKCCSRLFAIFPFTRRLAFGVICVGVLLIIQRSAQWYRWKSSSSWLEGKGRVEVKHQHVQTELVETEEQYIQAGMVDVNNQSVQTELVETEEQHVQAGRMEVKNQHVQTELLETEVQHVQAGEVLYKPLKQGRVEVKDQHVQTELVETEEQHVQAGSVEVKTQHVQTELVETRHQHVQAGKVEVNNQHVQTELIETKDQYIQAGKVLHKQGKVEVNNQHVQTEIIETKDQYIQAGTAEVKSQCVQTELVGTKDQQVQADIDAKEEKGECPRGRSVHFQPGTESPVTSPSRRLVRIPSFFELSYENLMEKYRLFHFVILDQDVRALLVNIHQPISEVIKKLCNTFGIENPEEYCLWFPKGGEKSRREKNTKGPHLYNNRSLANQYDFDMRPFVLHVRKHDSEFTSQEINTEDPGDILEEVGEEWPEFEESGVARQREFYQCCCGVVQGDYPIERVVAVELAALMVHVYVGDRNELRQWPPKGYSAKAFLPSMHQKASGIENEVNQAHRKLGGMDKTEAIEKAIELSKETLTYEGLFFDVKVPSESTNFLRRALMDHRIFGINHQGVFNVDKKTGKVLFTHRFSDIHHMKDSDDGLQINFHHWDTDYRAQTHQAKEITWLISLFINMTRRGQIHQAP